jgi:hypothetical protein
MQDQFEPSSAASRVLQPIFGTHWRWWIGLLMVSVFLPAFLFWKHIAFDPAHFVEEWTKLSLTTICVFLFIEVLQERRHTESHKRNLREFAARAVLEPLSAVVAKFKSARVGLFVGCTSDASQLLANGAAEILRIGGALDSATALSETLMFRMLLTRASLGLDAAGLADALMNLSHTRNWGTVPLGDLDHILDTLQRVIDTLQRDLSPTDWVAEH